jgi:hypothetical protein
MLKDLQCLQEFAAALERSNGFGLNNRLRCGSGRGCGSGSSRAGLALGRAGLLRATVNRKQQERGSDHYDPKTLGSHQHISPRSALEYSSCVR